MKMVDVTLPDGDVVAVSAPARPPKPKIRSDRRRELAAMWLESLSQPATQERIEALAPFVGRYRKGSHMHRIASHLVSQNQLPTADRVEELFLIRRATQERKRQQRVETVITDPGQVLTAIDTHWEIHGQGPPWRKLAESLGVNTYALEALLLELSRKKLVRYTRAPGSLRTVAAPPASASGVTEGIADR
ncbi:MAG: hypothetical protein L0G89_00225 [Janibacter sp.]|nr:hypothetical protein [Janibacter sp.]